MTAALPFAHWTPNGWWLFAELTRRALVVTRDGAPAREGDGLRTVIDATPDALEVVLHVDADTATVALRPDDATHRFRDHWAVELGRGIERWALVAGGDPVTVTNARGGELRARLRVWQCSVAPVLDGVVEQIPVDDVSFHRHTLQSSRAEDPPEGALPPCMIPTQPERAPWWEIDLGAAMFAAWVRVDLRGVPSGATVRVAVFAYKNPAGDPTRDTFEHEGAVEGDAAVAFAPNVVARFVRVTLVAPSPASLVIRSAEVFAAELFAPTLRDAVRRAFALHQSQTLFVARDGDDGPYVPTHSYGAVWTRAMALARGLAARLERDDTPRTAGRILVALATRNRPEWVMTELAALDRGYVVVPMNPDDSDDHIAKILAKCAPACVVCEDRDVARFDAVPLRVVCDAPEGAPHLRFDELVREGESAVVAPPEPRAPEDLYSVLFTSGSTGTPKGATRSYATVLRMLSTYGIDQGTRHLSFQPLSHLSERMYLPALLLQGAVVGFSRGGAHLMRELRDFEPTSVATVPRLFEVVMAAYRRRLAALRAASPDRPDAALEAEARDEARLAFGTRLRSVGVGSAPVSAELLAFLRRTYADLWVAEGYGSTELGTIAVDGKIMSHVEVRLVARDDAPRSPDAPERGEIFVRTPHQIDGYFGDESATRAALDADGFFATGDLGERGADGVVRVIGRLRNTVKLARGEFVSVERVETALSTAPGVDRVYVHADPGAESVAAVVVPLPDAPDDLAAVVRAHGRRAGLAAWELPRAVLVERAPFTAASGLLTANGKLARAALAARYRDALAAMGDAPEVVTETDDDALAVRVARVLSRALGRPLGPRDAIGPAAGVDSLAAAEAMTALGEAMGREVPLAWWFAAETPAALAAMLARFDVSGTEDTALAREDLRATVRGAEGIAPPRDPWRTVLLTGATGFLGAHLVESLVARTELTVLCMVRAGSDDEAARRLDAVLARYEIPVRVGDRVHAFAGDLAAPDLGLSDTWRARLRDEVDAVLHAGAQVHWLASYAALRGSNVTGTRALLELATTERARPFHFVSTISTAPVGGDETTQLAVDVALRSGGYGASKWVAETLARRAGDAGLSVAVYRPGMIAGHSTRGHGNPDDYLHRYLDGCAALGRYLDLDARLDMTPVDFVADGIVALMTSRPRGGDTWHLVNVDRSMTYAAHGRAMARAGLDVTPADYDAFRAALVAAPGSRLTALRGFFPASGFGMGMGPWPCARTVEALTALGVARPPVDDALVARYVARRSGQCA